MRSSIGHTSPTPIEEDEPAEGSEPRRCVRGRRDLPQPLDVAADTKEVEEVEGFVSHDLIGNVAPVNAYISGRWPLHWLEVLLLRARLSRGAQSEHHRAEKMSLLAARTELLWGSCLPSPGRTAQARRQGWCDMRSANVQYQRTAARQPMQRRTRRDSPSCTSLASMVAPGTNRRRS